MLFNIDFKYVCVFECAYVCVCVCGCVWGHRVAPVFPYFYVNSQDPVVDELDKVIHSSDREEIFRRCFRLLVGGLCI